MLHGAQRVGIVTARKVTYAALGGGYDAKHCKFPSRWLGFGFRALADLTPTNGGGLILVWFTSFILDIALNQY